MRRQMVYWLIIVTAGPFLVPLVNLKGGSFAQNLVVIGSVFGFLGVILLLWQFIFGLRFISSKLSNDTLWLNKLHKNIGKYGMLFIITHPFLKAVSYYGNVKFALLPSFSDPLFLQVGFGRLAFLLLLIVLVTSIFFRKNLGFRLWKYIHYASYLIMVLVFLHAPVIGTYLNSYPLLKGYWYILAVVFGVVVIYRVAVFLGFGSVTYLLKKKEQVGDIFVYTFETKGKKIIPVVGQYCYIKLKRFGEEHPFTVMETQPSNKTLTFGIKAVGKFTKKISKLEVGKPVLIEGPYGVFTLEGHSNIPKVIIAGGIGVTPFIDLVKKYSTNSTYMFYANEKVENAIRRDELKSKLGFRYFDVLSDSDALMPSSGSNVSGKNIILGRLDKEVISEIVPKSILKKARFFICGSMPFYKHYREVLLSMGVPKNKVYYEEFGF